ncbi:MAG: DNA cytosine methyltransferase, partial [bacterium]|nr:DNA cytosine methyltransferase [bacterium]
CGKLEDVEPQKLAGELREIDLILASPECTNHSPAKGNKPRCEISKDTAFQVVKFAKVFKPRWLVIENVINMRRWHRYPEFIGQIEALGYKTEPQVLNSADFGVPQSRKRLFILCDLQKQPEKLQPSYEKVVNAEEIINSNGAYPYRPLRTEKRARATLERADRAISALGEKEPFLIVYYGSDKAGGWQSLDRPLRTITTLDRFAIVRPNGKGHEMRMLQPDE